MKIIKNIIDKDEIDFLKKNIFSDDWKLVKKSAHRLGELGGKDITDFLISLLEQSDSRIRNIAALALEEIRDERALEPLLKSINKKENFNFNGTMVFALESLDCSKHLVEIFEILFYQTYESKMSAMSILDNQFFEFTKNDLINIEKMWKACLLNPEKCPEFENDEVKLEIQNSVDSFMKYLEE